VLIPEVARTTPVMGWMWVSDVMPWLETWSAEKCDCILTAWRIGAPEGGHVEMLPKPLQSELDRVRPCDCNRDLAPSSVSILGSGVDDPIICWPVLAGRADWMLWVAMHLALRSGDQAIIRRVVRTVCKVARPAEEVVNVDAYAVGGAAAYAANCTAAAATANSAAHAHAAHAAHAADAVRRELPWALYEGAIGSPLGSNQEASDG
jgi:hypothetical protein